MINGKIHPALKISQRRLSKTKGKVKIGILSVASDYIAVAIAAAVSYQVLTTLQKTAKLRRIVWKIATDIKRIGTVLGSSISEVRTLPLRVADTLDGPVVFAPEGNFVAFEISIVVTVNEPIAYVCEWCEQSHWGGGTSCHKCILSDASDIRCYNSPKLYSRGSHQATGLACDQASFALDPKISSSNNKLCDISIWRQQLQNVCC